MDEIGKNLKRLRRARGLSQEELASLSGVSRPTIARLECRPDAGGNTTLRIIRRLSVSLDVPAWVLMASEESRSAVA